MSRNALLSRLRGVTASRMARNVSGLIFLMSLVLRPLPQISNVKPTWPDHVLFGNAPLEVILVAAVTQPLRNSSAVQ